jgi:predicted ATPase
MINQLNIHNFKSHAHTLLTLAPLTLLAGVNGMGKSSVLQSLLLLRQSYQKSELQRGIFLNGNFCHIGTAKDALYENAQESEIQFSIRQKEECLDIFALINDNKLNDTVLGLKDLPSINLIQKFNVFTNKFQYLSAERLAPQESYKRDTDAVEFLKQLSDERGRGELVAHYLAHYGKKELPILALKHPNCKYSDLAGQVNTWLTEITPNVEVDIQEAKTNFELFFKFGNQNNAFRAENVGFGLSYALPIVVALLSAEPDSLILIENPEAHLHPQGQSKLAQLMALAAQNGVQIIAETHSDHILNGAAVMIAKGLVHCETVISYHIHRKNTERFATAYPVPILPNGQWDEDNLKKAKIKGFFDQILIDNAIILGL